MSSYLDAAYLVGLVALLVLLRYTTNQLILDPDPLQISSYLRSPISTRRYNFVSIALQ